MVVEEAKPPPPPPENSTTSLDEVSTTARTQSFFNALQELKNLGPQLYSAAERTEKSYRYGKQNWMVVENLKEYAERAVVNAVDHIGTVASKLNQIMDEQTLLEDISVVESKVDCLHQKLLTCKTYIDKEGLRQQLLLPADHTHHKHYTLPALAVGKKVDSSSQLQPTEMCSHLQNKPTKPKLVLFGSPAPKTLSWHIATQAKSKLKRASYSLFMRDENTKMSGGRTSTTSSSDVEEGTRAKTSSSTRRRSLRPGPASFVAMQTLGIDSSEGYKPIIVTAPNQQLFGDEQEENAKLHVPSRSNNNNIARSTTLFVKHKIKRVMIRTGA
ncbi:unnamed protein product [Cuscuta campestris]|uniref:Protein ABIL1 n=1 Tax=Cuscuta campestris TaxID=132261 RepID=A0A484LHP6_9ASTE|nr:unnamed protein product [Cuscuta campestris]